MRKKYAFLFYFLMTTCFILKAQTSKVDSNFHLYLLVGQSNMAGRGALNTENKIANTKILMLDSNNNWVPAKDPVHFDKLNAVGVGPALSFANEMLKNSSNPNVTIGLIPCAWGGSPIKAWDKDVIYLNRVYPYNNAIARANAAEKSGVLKGILWHQGESDNDSIKASRYLAKLQNLIKRFRVDLNQPELPFIAGEIGYFNKVNYINAVINQLPNGVKSTAVVSAVNLQDKGDLLHFNTTSALELGKRYATAMMSVQKNQAVKVVSDNAVVVLCFDDAEISHYNVVAPILKKYSYNATFLVCEMPWKSQDDSAYYMKWQQIAQLNKMGFEIGNHTGHHKNMTKLSRVDMQKEIAYIELKCKENGIPKPISFAYPGNREDSLSQVVLKEMGYRNARTGGSKYYNLVDDKKLAIPSFTMGSSDKLKERTWKALKSLANGQVLVFTIHGVPDIAHPDYTTSEKDFEEYLQYMKAHRFKVIALKDLQHID